MKSKEDIQNGKSEMFYSIQKLIIGNETSSIVQYMGFLLKAGDADLFDRMYEIFGDDFPKLMDKEIIRDAAIYMVQSDRSLQMLRYLIDTLEIDYLQDLHNQWGDNLLKIACEYGAKETALYLIDKGFYKKENGAVNATNETPLHGAARSGMYDVIKALIVKYKAYDPEMIFNGNNQVGDNFMHILNIFNHGDVYRRLIKDKIFLSNSQYRKFINLENQHNYCCTQSKEMLKNLKYLQREPHEPDQKMDSMSEAISFLYKAIFSDNDERLIDQAINKLYGEIKSNQDYIIEARLGTISEKSQMMLELLMHNCIRVASLDVDKYKDVLSYIEVVCDLGNFYNIKFELCVALAQSYALTGDNIEKIIKYSKKAEEVYNNFPNLDYKIEVVTFFFNFGIFCLKYNFYSGYQENTLRDLYDSELAMQKDGYNYIEKALNLIKQSCSQNSFQNKSDYTTILKKIFKIYLEDGIGSLDDLVSIAGLMPDQKLSKLYILSAFLNMSDVPTGVLFNAFGFPEQYAYYEQEDAVIFYTLKAEACLRDGDVNRAITILQKTALSGKSDKWSSFDEGLDVLVSKTLHLYLYSGRYEEGYVFLKKLYHKMPQIFSGPATNYKVKLYETMILEHNNISDKVDEILRHSGLKVIFFENMLVTICRLVLNNEYQEAYEKLVRLKQIASPEDSVLVNKYITCCTSLLSKIMHEGDSDKITESSSESFDSDYDKENAPDKANIDNIRKSQARDKPPEYELSPVDIDQISNEAELEQALTKLSGRQIHNWFQQQKSKLIQNSKDDYSYLIGKAKGKSWVVGDKIYNLTPDSAALEMGSFDKLENISHEIKAKMASKSCAKLYEIGENYYAAIDPEIFESLDGLLSKKFTQAIKNGIVKSSSGSSGIKMIGHKLLELKIYGQDYRLYTDHIYKNSAGKSLIVFDHSGNHSKIDRVCSISGLEKINVPCIYDGIGDLLNHSEDKCFKEVDDICLIGDAY